jgi:antibiotic biosynthesis monooxygenase (ABM) superfamily enzyme
MRRRSYLKTLAAAGMVAALPLGAETDAKSIQLHVDLAVDPSKEKQMLDIFHRQFAPAAAKQPGFIDAKMLKLRQALQGSAPTGANYRFVLRFQTEDQRQHWIQTPIHQKLWPTIENTLSSKNYTVLLYDVS